MRTRRLMASVAAVILAAAMLLSGCTSLSLNSSDILTPPRAAGNRAELQKLIEKNAGGSYSLITPVSGEYKSGVVNHDFDGDGSEEAVAFYTDSKGAAGALVASNRGGSYTELGSCALSSPNISSVSFADTDADGTDELFISCDTGSPSAKLSVCFVGEELIKVDVAEGFIGFVTGDLDGDSAADILLFMPANAEATAMATLMTFINGVFHEKSSCEVDPAVEAYAKLSCGKISSAINGVAADGVNEDGEYTTQLIYYDAKSNSLINPLFIYAGYDKTLRSSKIFACDANGDGVIEIPVCEPMKRSKDEDASHVCTAVHWRRYEPKEIAPVPAGEALLCDTMGFTLNLKDDSFDEVTGRCADATIMDLFAVSDSEKSILGDRLLTIRYYDKGGFSGGGSGETAIYESETGVYTCELLEDSGYTLEEVKNGFKPIEK